MTWNHLIFALLAGLAGHHRPGLVGSLRADLITARNQAREDRIAARRLLHEEQRRSQEYAATAVRLRAELDAERARNADLTAALRRLDEEVRHG